MLPPCFATTSSVLTNAPRNLPPQCAKLARPSHHGSFGIDLQDSRPVYYLCLSDTVYCQVEERVRPVQRGSIPWRYESASFF